MDVEATLDGKFRPHLVPVLTRVGKGAVLHNYPFAPSEFLMSNALVWFELYFNIQLHFFLACG